MFLRRISRLADTILLMLDQVSWNQKRLV